MASSRRLALVCLTLVITIGAWGRFADLGGRPLWTDELNHFYVAKSLAAGKGATLPSGNVYARGIGFSRAIALTQKFVQKPALATRLPSAVLGVVGLILIAVITWKMAGPWAAVWATVLLAIYPAMVTQSRTGRFYMYQLDLGLVALLGGWLATRHGVDDVQTTRQLATKWLWMAVAAAALFLAYRVQPTTLPIVAALGLWVGFVALDDLRRGGRNAWRRSVPVQAVAAASVVVLVLLIAGEAGPVASAWWRRANWAATWTGYERGPAIFYVSQLLATIPWVGSFFPLFAVISFKQLPRQTLYLLTWFLIPLAIHSLVLAWKGDRYFLLPLPALFIITGIGVSGMLGYFARLGRDSASASEPTPGLLTSMLIVVVSGWAVYTLPAWIEFSRQSRVVPDTRPWITAGMILAKNPEARRVPWGSMDPLTTFHYWRRTDFGTQPGLLDNAVPATRRHPGLRYPAVADSVQLDFYTGVPIILKPAAIRAAYQQYGAVVIGFDSSLVAFTDPELVETLQREGSELCEGRCRTLRLYLWRFGERQTP